MHGPMNVKSLQK